MKILDNGFVLVFTFFTYLVTFHDGTKIISNSWKYGRLRRLRWIPLRIGMWLLPSNFKERVKKFTNDDVEIQITKLNGDFKNEQMSALIHLEYLLDFIPENSDNSDDLNNIDKIKRAIYKLLWHTKTDSEVAKKAVDMLCGNERLRPECGCNE
jgi:hypothetical protein